MENETIVNNLVATSRSLIEHREDIDRLNKKLDGLCEDNAKLWTHMYAFEDETGDHLTGLEKKIDSMAKATASMFIEHRKSIIALQKGLLDQPKAYELEARWKMLRNHIKKFDWWSANEILRRMDEMEAK